jgi:hypothetical protein
LKMVLLFFHTLYIK